MNSSHTSVRVPVPARVLWKWTTVSAVLHFCAIGGLCYSSFLQTEKREAALKAKTPDAPAAAPEETPRDQPKPESPASAQQSASPAPVPAPPDPKSAAPAGPAAAPTAPPAPAVQAEVAKPPPPPAEAVANKGAPPSAEKVLGIDKVAKPEDAPKGANPFSGKDDDLLKDLK